MKLSEKNTETFFQTVKRTIVTTAIISIILFLLRVFPSDSRSSFVLLGTIFTAVFCIVFGGHWLEVFFINQIKFVLPKNIFILYFIRIFYWFLSAIPLFALASLVDNLLSNKTRHLGNWWTFGLIYIGIQLVMHAIMHVRLKKSFYNGVY